MRKSPMNHPVNLLHRSRIFMMVPSVRIQLRTKWRRCISISKVRRPIGEIKGVNQRGQASLIGRGIGLGWWFS
jgi:hypothetical protein